MLPIQGTAASSPEHNGCVTLAFTWQWRAYDADQALAPRAWSASIPIRRRRTYACHNIANWINETRMQLRVGDSDHD